MEEFLQYVDMINIKLSLEYKATMGKEFSDYADRIINKFYPTAFKGCKN